jgi:hypothetical protein
LVVLLSVSVLSVPTWALTRYAGPSGGGGACTNPGLPCSLANVLGVLVSGDTLILQGGTYTLPHTRDGCPWLNIPSSASGTTWRPDNGATVTLNGGGLLGSDGNLSSFTMDGTAGTLILDMQRCGSFFNHSDSTFFRDSTFRNLEMSHGVGAFSGNMQNVLLENLNVHHIGREPDSPSDFNRTQECANSVAGANINQRGHCHGIYGTQPSSNVTVKGGRWWYIDGSAWEVYGTNNTAREMTIEDTGNAGLFLLFPGNNFTAYNNVVTNATLGISACRSDAQLYNNTILNNEEAGIGAIGDPCSTSNTPTARNNILMNNPNGPFGWTGDPSRVSNNLCNLAGGDCALNSTPDATFANAPEGDYHLKPGSPAINAGTNLAGVPSTDQEGRSRVGAVDIGAFECQATTPGADCTDAVPPPTLGLVVEHKTNGTDTSGNGFPAATLTGGTLTNGAPLTSNNTTSFVFDGVNDAMIEAADAAFRPAEFCMVAWMSSTTPPAAGEVCRLMSVGAAAVLGYNDAGELFGYINNGQAEVVNTVSVTNGLTHLLGLSYDGTFLRGWKDNANFQSVPFAVGMTYTGSEQLAYGGVATKYCATRANNFRFFDRACTPQDMQQIFLEAPIVTTGTTASHWRFDQADSAEGTHIAGQAVDAPSITQARGGKLQMAWNVKRNGSTTSEHYGLECSLNSTTVFTQIDNSCAVNPACIATDTIKAMGDFTADLGDISGDGFIFVPGRYVVDTINSGLQTSLADGRFTVWRYTLAFRQTLAHNDVVRCRPRTAAGVLDGYPTVLPTITIDAPRLAGGSGTTKGVTSRGGTRR